MTDSRLTTLLIAIVMLAALVGCAPLAPEEEPGAEMTTRTIDLTRPPLDVWERIRRGYAIPNLNTELTQQWTDYYAKHPQSIQRMADRAGPYLYYIVDEINRRGLPTELALLPFVESAYNPNAYSRAHASGLWQFIPSTGTAFELEQTWWRDQRRDPIASTNAALDYLEYLYEYQGDWYLAFASYNWGEGSVRRALARNEQAGLPLDYRYLRMPRETTTMFQYMMDKSSALFMSEHQLQHFDTNNLPHELANGYLNYEVTMDGLTTTVSNQAELAAEQAKRNEWLLRLSGATRNLRLAF